MNDLTVTKEKDLSQIRVAFKKLAAKAVARGYKGEELTDKDRLEITEKYFKKFNVKMK